LHVNTIQAEDTDSHQYGKTREVLELTYTISLSALFEFGCDKA